MKRRNFITKSGLSIGTLTFLSAILSQATVQKESKTNQSVSPVDEGEFTDNDADYEHWETSTNGLIRSKYLMTEKGEGLEGSCRLIRFTEQALNIGFKVPRHYHPEGELTYVLAGQFEQLEINPKTGTKEFIKYKQGDCIWMPAQSIHEESRFLDNGVTILSFTPKNIKFKDF